MQPFLPTGSTFLGLPVQLCLDPQVAAQAVREIRSGSNGSLNPQTIAAMTPADWAGELAALTDTSPAVANPHIQQKLVALSLGLQRQHFRETGRFRWETLSPQTVGSMTAEEKGSVAVQHIDEVENWVADVADRLRADPDRVGDLLQETESRLERFRLLRPEPRGGTQTEQWVNALYSSASQLEEPFLGYLQLLAKYPERTEILEKLRALREPIPVEILGRQGYRVRRSLREIAQTLIYWLEINFPQRRWERGQLVCQTEGGLVTHGQRAYLFHPAWPPTPNDRLVGKYLKLLGWSLERETGRNAGGEKTVRVRLDFGMHAVHHPESDAGIRDAEGGFEIAALRPGDAARLSLKDKLELAKQLVGEHEELAKRILQWIAGNPLRDVARLRRYNLLLRSEAKRLAELFPSFEEPGLNALIHDLRYAARYIVERLGSSLRFGISFLQSGNEWAEVRERVFRDLEPEEIHLLNGVIHAPKHLSRLAENLIGWLRAIPPTSEGWIRDQWVLGLPKGSRPESTCSSALRFVAWPPDQQNDPVLHTYLDLLHWPLIVQPSPSGYYYTVTVHFGFMGE